MTDRPYKETVTKLQELCYAKKGIFLPDWLSAAIEAAIAKAVQEKDQEIERLRNIITEYESIQYLGRNRKP